MAIARLALESKSEREGGLPLALKPLARRILGPQYAEAGRQIDDALKMIWHNKLKDLEFKLKPYGISRRIINEVLKDVTSTLEEFPDDVQKIWNTWTLTSRITYKDIDKNLMHKYGACDVILVLELTKKLLPIVSAKNQINILKREQRLIMPLVRMERTGYTVDKKYLIKCKQALIFEINNIKEINEKLCGENISPNQHQAIKDMLKNKFGYELASTDKNQMSILIATDDKMPDVVKEYLNNVIYLRTLYKWMSTYVNSMLNKLNATKDTKVYTQYNPNGAISGRFTSNFQQFPKNPIMSHLGDFELFHPRKMFITDPEYPEMAFIDYSQVELRLQAEYTYYATGGLGDVNMLRAYMPFQCHKLNGVWIHDDDLEDWQGVDLHTQSTKEAFPELDVNSPEFKKMRSIGKRVNFALIYGSSLRKIQEILADCDPDVVAKLYNGFKSKFKDVKTYSNWVARHWVTNGGYVTNLLGRRYYIEDSKDIYKLNNYLIQGSAADIIKLVIIRVDAYLRQHKLKTRLQGCIHDELAICVAEGEHDVIYKIKQIMETTVKTYVPLVAEISISNTNWAEKGGEH
jgi:DNA polymerase-1